jgi:hypothetical protein
LQQLEAIAAEQAPGEAVQRTRGCAANPRLCSELETGVRSYEKGLGTNGFE